MTLCPARPVAPNATRFPDFAPSRAIAVEDKIHFAQALFRSGADGKALTVQLNLARILN